MVVTYNESQFRVGPWGLNKAPCGGLHPVLNAYWCGDCDVGLVSGVGLGFGGLWWFG